LIFNSLPEMIVFDSIEGLGLVEKRLKSFRAHRRKQVVQLVACSRLLQELHDALLLKHL
jgi:hypothetical protein